MASGGNRKEIKEAFLKGMNRFHKIAICSIFGFAHFVMHFCGCIRYLIASKIFAKQEQRAQYYNALVKLNFQRVILYMIPFSETVLMAIALTLVHAFKDNLKVGLLANVSDGGFYALCVAACLVSMWLICSLVWHFKVREAAVLKICDNQPLEGLDKLTVGQISSLKGLSLIEKNADDSFQLKERKGCCECYDPSALMPLYYLDRKSLEKDKDGAKIHIFNSLTLPFAALNHFALLARIVGQGCRLPISAILDVLSLGINCIGEKKSHQSDSFVKEDLRDLVGFCKIFGLDSISLVTGGTFGAQTDTKVCAILEKGKTCRK